MANPSDKRITEEMKFVSDEDVDATEIFLPGRTVPRCNLGSSGRSRDEKSTKGKIRSCQQKRYFTVPDNCSQDDCDDIFGDVLSKEKDNIPHFDMKFTGANAEQHPVVIEKSDVSEEISHNFCVTADVKNLPEENRQNVIGENCESSPELPVNYASSSATVSSAPFSVHSNTGSEVNFCEIENSDLPLDAKDISLFGNVNSQFNFSLNLPEQVVPEKGKRYENLSKTCASRTIPPDEVIIEAMNLIFDDNVDATRIFALEKKEPVNLDPCSYGKNRGSGSGKVKAKRKKYRSALDDLFEDDSDEIFGTAVSKQNKIATPAEANVSEGELELPHLAVEESWRISHNFDWEDAVSSGVENREHVLDMGCDSSEAELTVKHESASTSDPVTVVPEALLYCSKVEDSCEKDERRENEEIVLDIRQNLGSVEPISKNKPDLALENLKLPFADGRLDSCDNEIKGKETALLKHENLKNDLSTSSPNKRRNSGDVSDSHEMPDVISSSLLPEEEEYENPSKKRKQTGSTLESELTRNSQTEAENMLTHVPNFNFIDLHGLEKTFVGHLKNTEETTKQQDRKEKSEHSTKARPSTSRPCQLTFKEVEDKEIEELFGSVKHKKNIASTEANSVVRQTKENMTSVKNNDLSRISDPLLNTESSDDAESLLNADFTNLLRNRKPELTKNLQEGSHSAETGVLQNAKSSLDDLSKEPLLKSGQECTRSFISQLPHAFLCKTLLLCGSGILLVTMPLLLLFLPVYILAVFNAMFLTSMLIVGAIVFMSCFGKKKMQGKNLFVHGNDSDHLQLPEIKSLQATHDVFQGWMNELNDSYDISNCHFSRLRSVYVSLDGSTLRLRTPKKRIPKRAICSESSPFPGSFIKQRFYDLCGSKVTTLPEGLVLRRMWSKKYPLLIEVPARRTDKENSIVSQIEGRSGGQDVERLNENNCTRLVLFARTCREKEEWFRRFSAAALSSPLSPCLDSLVQNTPIGGSIPPSLSNTRMDAPSESEFEVLHSVSHDQNSSDYLGSMAKVLSLNNDSVCEPQLLWINAFITRCTMDVFREDHRIEVIKKKLGKKLLTAKIPYFMDDVRLVEFDLGKEVPLICKATLPSIDDRGLWVDLDITYGGRIRMAIETKCNLFKLKGISPTDVRKVGKSSAATNSDEEDSGESSTDDGSDSEEFNDLEREKPRVNWLLNLADRITSSQYFQRATKVERIKRAMESVSSKSLMLSVELSSLKGTLAVNIPPPPTDRIWYGFRNMPDLEMSVAVQVGQRQITLTPLTSWIEKKLIIELERALVMPNMDDILFSLMCDHMTNRHIPPTGNQK